MPDMMRVADSAFKVLAAEFAVARAGAASPYLSFMAVNGCNSASVT